MTEPKKWFDRKFDLAFPAAMLPNVQARLRGTPARLDDLLRGRPQSVLVHKPEGKWSAQEHAGHLLDLELLWLSRVADYAAERERLTPADLTNRLTHDANHNERSLVSILREFRTSRENLLKAVVTLDPPAFTITIPHPRLQTPMGIMDHLHFVAEHDDHHLAHIWELVKNS